MTKKANEPAEEKEIQDLSTDNTENQTADSETSEKSSNPKKETKSAKITGKSRDKKSKDQSKKLKKQATEIEELTEKITSIEEASAEWHNKYLRLSAEFDNYRKRTLKEKAELTKQANADLLKDLLSVVDDFERGLDNINKSEDVESLKQGVELIYTKFVEFTRRNGIKEIEAKEKDFDLDYHEAITKIPAPTEELKGKVVDVIEKGYLLSDKVLRYSKVVVGE